MWAKRSGEWRRGERRGGSDRLSSAGVSALTHRASRSRIRTDRIRMARGPMTRIRIDIRIRITSDSHRLLLLHSRRSRPTPTAAAAHHDLVTPACPYARNPHRLACVTLIHRVRSATDGDVALADTAMSPRVSSSAAVHRGRGHARHAMGHSTVRECG
jgi:hypothetical protein